MKTFKSNLTLTACGLLLFLLAAFASNNPQPTGNKYLTMRTFEASMGGSSKIMIIYEDGTTEELDLDKYRIDNMLPNAVKINQAINKIAGKGYEFVSSSGGEYTSLYTFVKK
jgi:hypothetical protein